MKNRNNLSAKDRNISRGLAKIWREVKRPFQQGLRSLHHFSVRKTKVESSIQIEAIIQDVLYNPAYIDCTCWIPREWDKFLGNQPNDELKKLHDRLVLNMDELSREVVARCIARRLFVMEYGPNRVLWNVASKLFGLIYPLDYEEQERIRTLGEAYSLSYKFPIHDFTEHLATGFGINLFPREFQNKIIDKDIIDGGGYSGDSAMIFTEYGPRRVYAFEPNPDTIPALKKILMENTSVLGERKDRIEVVPFALGRSKGTLTLHSNGQLDAGATLLPRNHGSKVYEVDVISIDEFVERHNLDIGLIKLDIEGAEYDAILGAKETITKQKPLLIISIYHTCKDFFEIKPLIESWNLGYKFEVRHHLPSLPDVDIMLMAY